MFRNMFVGAIALCVGSASVVAYGAAKDDVQAAAKKLAEVGNYSWTSTTEGGFGGGAAEGKTTKDGITMLSQQMRDNTVQAVIKGDKGAVKTEDGWKSSAELASAEGPGRFMGRMVTGFRSPAAQAEELAGKSADLAKVEDAYTGTLTEEGAKSLLTFGGRGRGGAGGGGGGAGGQGPQIKNAKGTVKFWTKDGVLSKVVYNVQGSMTFGDQDRDVNRTTTIEIKDVGTTKVEIPAEAKAKLE